MSERPANDRELLEALASATSSKLLLFALVAGLAGLVITLTAGKVAELFSTYVPWLSFIGRGSLEAVGGAVLSSSVILIAFEQYVRRQSQAIERARAEQLLAQYEKRLVEKIPSMLSVGDQATIDALVRVTHPEQLRTLGVKTLSAALGSEEVVAGSLQQLSDRLDQSKEIWRGLRIHMTVRPTSTDHDADSSYFDVNIIASFSCSELAQVSAVCTTSLDEYKTLLASGKYVWVWYHEPTRQFSRPNRDAFCVEECIVNGDRSEIGYAEAENAAYFQTLESYSGKNKYDVKVTLRARIQRRGHCLYFNVPRVCDYVRYDLDYADCGIAFVTVLDALGAPRRPSIEKLRGANERVVVEMSDWIFPQSGVVFVWVLAVEMEPSFAELLNDSASQVAK